METDRRRRSATGDGRPLLPQNSNVNADDVVEPLFPLDKETMISVLQPVSAASLLCISIINVSTALNLGTGQSVNPHVRTILATLPYAFLPLGFSALAAAVAAKTRPHLVGYASGCLLGELVFTSVVGGVINLVRAGADPLAAGVFSLVTLAVTVLGWSVMCSYPKFLRFWRADTGKAADPDALGSRRQPDCVVTNPRMAKLVTIPALMFAAVVIGMFVYTLCLHLKIDGPLWEALVSCVVESPLFVAPLCILPKLTDAFVSIYATGSPAGSGGDVPSVLLPYEQV